jgi:imidazole glycerol-phosphate synthase subunit HisH
MIAVVDYGAANLLSITRALEACGASVTVTSELEVIAAAEGVVLPGVGAAGAAMQRLRASGVDAALREVAASGKPLLGLCLGMQLFFERLTEDGATGLCILPGEVPLLPPGRKIPHMGWNTLEWTPGAPGTELFAGLTPSAYGYFVHSYHCAPVQPAHAVAWTEYAGLPICAAVASGNVHGLQFHPEKSSATGLTMLASWLALVGRGRASGNPLGVEAHAWQR